MTRGAAGIDLPEASGLTVAAAIGEAVAVSRLVSPRVRLIAVTAALVSAVSALFARRDEWKHGVLAENG